MGYWIVVVLAMLATGIGLGMLFTGKYEAATASFMLAIVLILLAIIIPKGKAR